MSSALPREELLARRLDQVLPPDSATTPRGDDDPLVDLAVRLTALAPAAPSALSLARMEARMLDAFDRQAARPRPVRRAASLAARWALAASIILALMTAGLVPASASSLPGDLLYGVKRLAERAALTFTPDADARAALHLDHAARRAEEALALLNRGDQIDPALLADGQASALSAQQAASPALRASSIFKDEQSAALALLSEAAQRNISGNLPVPETTAEQPTWTPTATETGTASATATPTFTPTATSSPTSTVTPSASPTATQPSSATRTPQPSSTHTPQPSATWTPSLTPMPAASRTHTASPRPSRTPNICPGNSCDSQGVPGGNPPGQQGNPECPGNSCNAPGRSGENGGGGGGGSGNSGNGSGNNGSGGGNGNGNNGNGNSGNGNGNNGNGNGNGNGGN